MLDALRVAERHFAGAHRYFRNSSIFVFCSLISMPCPSSRAVDRKMENAFRSWLLRTRFPIRAKTQWGLWMAIMLIANQRSPTAQAAAKVIFVGTPSREQACRLTDQRCVWRIADFRHKSVIRHTQAVAGSAHAREFRSSSQRISNVRDCWRREGDLNRRDPSKSRALPRFRGICDSPEITSALVRLLLWLGDGFDPEAFSIDKVNGQLAPLQDARVKPAAGKK